VLFYIFIPRALPLAWYVPLSADNSIDSLQLSSNAIQNLLPGGLISGSFLGIIGDYIAFSACFLPHINLLDLEVICYLPVTASSAKGNFRVPVAM